MKESKDSKDKHEMYIEEPEKYFTEKGVWSNVYDFLNIDTSKYKKSKEEWVKYCKMLKCHLGAACPEIQFLGVIELLSSPRISPMVSENSMSMDLTSG